MDSAFWIGKWQNEHDHLMIIQANPLKLAKYPFQVDILDKVSETPFERSLLNGKDYSTKMPARINDQQHLVVELGSAGLGPTLTLVKQNDTHEVRLMPSIGMGLYDDYEDDFGVPWIFPISAFRKIAL